MTNTHPARLVAVLMLLAAAATAALIATPDPLGAAHPPWPTLAVTLTAGAIYYLGDRFRLRLSIGGDQELNATIGWPGHVFGILFLPPALMVVARVAGGLLQNRHLHPAPMASNVGLGVLETSLIAFAWSRFGGELLYTPRSAALLVTIALCDALVGWVGLASCVGSYTAKWHLTGSEALRAMVLDASQVAVVLLVVAGFAVAPWTIGVVPLVGLLAAAFHREHRAMSKRHDQAQRVVDFVSTISADSTIKQMADTTMEWVQTVLGFRTVEMALQHDDGITETFFLSGSRDRPGTPLWEQFDALGIPEVTIHDFAGTHAPVLDSLGTGSAYVMPLSHNGDRIGVLIATDLGRMMTPTSEAPNDREMLRRLLQGFTAHAASALQSRLLTERLHKQATTDDLTRLPNRANVYQRIAEAAACGPAAVLLLDLDGFKSVNDTLGHQAGDTLLRQVAARFRENVTGTVARLGGDEFVVLVPGGTRASAETAAAQVFTAISEPIVVDGHPLTVRASVGAALAPHHGTDSSALLRHADDAMYQAKTSGTRFQVYGDYQHAGTLAPA